MTERVEVCKQHLDFSIRWKGPKIGIFEMRRHYTNYFKGIENFKPFRMRLVEAGTYEETIEILDEIAGQYMLMY
jgi:tRNA-dihydrouridine synthase B